MRSVIATAPIRICDCGGWTDTWFARHGSVFHMAIEPGVRVRIDLKAVFGPPPPVAMNAVNLADRYDFTPGTRPFVRHPLLEAAVEAVGLPPHAATAITIESTIPPGASMGTSAAVTVALIGALHAASGIHADPDAIASAAHRVEVKQLGQQSGVQDQLAAAYGGINFVDIYEYPLARVHPLAVSHETHEALERQLLLVYLGRAHSSSAIHEAVIRDIADAGAEHPALVDLRQAAAAARDAVLAGDLEALGRAMRANTDAQRRLHPSLVGPDAQRVIGAALAHDVMGWKVNGAGGDGGSLTLLCGPDPAARDAIEDAVEADAAGCRVIPFRLAQAGLRVWDATP